MLYAVIMAGGTGTRFWPESRARRPKQLLPMLGGTTMIRTTVNRLRGLASRDRLIVSTTAELAASIAQELPELPRGSILAEPCKRNTAPCIGLAAHMIVRHDPDAVMGVMPADHVIASEETFREAIRYAEALVEEDPRRLITFGIPPTYPAEGFGYIERGEAVELKTRAEFPSSPGTYRVRRFREKPDLETARQYLEAGRYSWNSGIFVWKARRILEELQRFEPEMHERLAALAESIDTAQFEGTLRKEFTAIKGKSIDYAVMERAEEVLVVEAPFDWDDVGSWRALARLKGVDEDGNTLDAKHLGIETSGTIVRGGRDHLIVTVGLADCIVVHTSDATLVAHKDHEESIRHVVDELQKRGWAEYL
ncbi:MAG: mannose-1-phosphate guanylyltransferase [Thermoguttaceae bacterium]|nr:mannose-1-phosphate guanylyltransferase [Thermoguttaceae bacterium]